MDRRGGARGAGPGVGDALAGAPGEHVQIRDGGSELDAHVRGPVAVEGRGGRLQAGGVCEGVGGGRVGLRAVGGGEVCDVVVRVGWQGQAGVGEVHREGAGGGGAPGSGEATASSGTPWVRNDKEGRGDEVRLW